jgi:hypothetical protein
VNTDIIDTGRKFGTGVNDTAGKFYAVSATLVENLPPVSTTPGENFATGTAGVVHAGDKFATGVNNTGDK